MGETKAKTKSAMLTELESIKGLLLEDDDIPILQEVIDQQLGSADPSFSSSASSYQGAGSDQNYSLDHESRFDQATSFDHQDSANFDDDLHFDEPHTNEPASTKTPAELAAKPAARVIVEQQRDFFSSIHDADTAEELLDSLDDLEEKTSRITAQKNQADSLRANRPVLAKPLGENPFLPQHIRERLHGNNPPPLFASETARKIATTSRPVTQLGSTQSRFANRPNNAQQELIDSIVARVMPEIEKELRQRLESMSRSMLDELNR
jgi:hypothetical protein